MTTYQDWLDELDTKLDTVDDGISTLLTSTNNLFASSNGLLQSSIPLQNSASSMFGPTGATSKCLNHIGYSLSDFCDLYSDFQIVVVWDWILDDGGIDPDQVFEPISGGNGNGAGFEVKQIGRLTLPYGPATVGNQTALGQTGFRVPLEVNILSNLQNTNLYFGVDLISQYQGSQVVAATIASPVRIAAKPGLANQARWTIEKEAGVPVASVVASTVIDVPQVSLLPTPPKLWSTWHDGSARLAGRVKARARGRQGFMAPSPGGYPVGIRLQLGVLTDEITAQVQAKGVRLLSGPTVTGDKSFSLSAGVEFRRSVNIGPKDLASARVKVWQNFTGELIPSGSRLFVVVNPTGSPGTDVSIRPKIPLLSDWVEDIIEGFVEGKIPAISGISKSFFLSGVSDFDVWLSDQFITLGIEPV